MTGVQKVGVNYLNKQMLKANIQDFANLINAIAAKSQDFALSLAEEGVRSDVTPAILRGQLSKDMFTSAGKMTKKAKQDMIVGMKLKGIPLDVKIKDAIDLVANGDFS